jgi:hypothetical protein
MNQEQAVFPVFYFPPISYYYYLLQFDNVLLETNEHYIKQTYRNRCDIMSPNGKLSLIVPVQKTGQRKIMSRVKIQQSGNWQKIHWKTLEASYRSSPYFEYYEDYFKPIFEEEIASLTDFNLKMFEVVNKILKMNIQYVFTEEYHKEYKHDYRAFFSTKKINEPLHFETYIQVFSSKFEFEENLSIVDLIFNEGPNALNYIKSLRVKEPINS